MVKIEERISNMVFSYLQKFSGIKREDFDRLLPFLEVRNFDKKESVLKEGEVDEYINIVVKGILRKYIRVKKRDVTIQLATEGHLIQSEISFHERKPSDVIIEALEPTVIVSMHHKNVQQVLKQIPGAEELGRIIISYMFIKKDSRTYMQLKYNTRERFLEFVRKNPHMLQRVPQKILASYLNIEPETFSRLKHLVAKA